MKEEKTKTNELIPLIIAKECLKSIEKEGYNKSSLLFQFSKQMSYFCKMSSKQKNNSKERKRELLKLSNDFDRIANLFKKVDLK